MTKENLQNHDSTKSEIYQNILISAPGRGSNYLQKIYYEVDEIDKSKTDYLQLFILSTGWQRQKIKRYVIAHFLINFDGFIT